MLTLNWLHSPRGLKAFLYSELIPYSSQFPVVISLALLSLIPKLFNNWDHNNILKWHTDKGFVNFYAQIDVENRKRKQVLTYFVTVLLIYLINCLSKINLCDQIFNNGSTSWTMDSLNVTHPISFHWLCGCTLQIILGLGYSAFYVNLGLLMKIAINACWICM